ncbi:MAG: HPr family phosphocarrier protein [Gammaproteobacteria bacterium]|nr:MAG: HPr family phosphocarrier protein [Gammaproteobacteria bacterium]
MIEKQLEICNKLGLHARAAAKLTKTASQFSSEVIVSAKGKDVNAKSIMGLLMLAASKGTPITIRTDGNDENQALAAISQLINNRFDEDE